MYKLLLTSFLMAIVSMPLSAQEPPDTLTFDVVGWGVVAGVGHNCPIVNNKVDLYEGATIRCPVWLMDSDGNRTLGTVRPEVADTTFVTVTVENDTLLVIHQKRKGGNTHVRLVPVPIMMIGAYYPDGDPGAMDWEYPLALPAQWDSETMVISWQARTILCGYVNGRYNPVAKTDWLCPDLGGSILPVFPVTWTVTDEYAYPSPIGLPQAIPLVAQNNG